jgi:hypothetical protein
MGKRRASISLDQQFNLPEESGPMITFLPDPDFFKSLRYLDNKRLGKQRVEAKMVLDMLTGIGHKRGWNNHPVVGMWRGYESALGLYCSLAIREWMVRGFQNNMVPTYDFNNNYALQAPALFGYAPEKFVTIDKMEYPPWLGNEELHASHRSNLMRKDFEYYKDFGWKESIHLPYVWPKGKSVEDLVEDEVPLNEALRMLERHRKRGRDKVTTLYDRLTELFVNAQEPADGFCLVREQDLASLRSLIMGEFEDKTNKDAGEVEEADEQGEEEEYIEGSGDLEISRDFNTVSKQGSLL